MPSYSNSLNNLSLKESLSPSSTRVPPPITLECFLALSQVSPFYPDLYAPSQITVQMEPVSIFTHTELIIGKVSQIIASENTLVLETGQKVLYDYLCLNIGSKTRDYSSIPGVQEFALCTRPINDLLTKIEAKEQEMLALGVIP